MLPRMVNDELWELIAPLLPRERRRYRYPGRRRLDDCKVLNGILSCSPPGSPGNGCRRSSASANGIPLACLGSQRWVVERTLYWLHQYRRLRIRYKRRADIHQAFLSLACSLICLRQLNRSFR